jgi:hypothetical protein
MLLSCSSGEDKVSAEGKNKAPAAPVAVVTAPVIQKTVPLATELTARIDATDSVDIRARVKVFLAT